ncbi:MAG: hypothetical protein FD165_587 [Gammaproteobacteria bacterium]|nr:MAG: hypothetical protein FD165_587 [Gammaproteobacteria bacterium]TND02151.1 MAG: hypothetical protein FD120_2315 [Gammaproteobacteria bacterium]
MIARLLVSAGLVVVGYAIGRTVNNFQETRDGILDSIKEEVVSDEDLLKEDDKDDNTIA